MDWAHIIQAFLSLIFVIGLLLLSLWSFKCLESKGIKSRFIKKLKADSRLNIIEYKRIDNKNALVLFSCDSQDFAVILGATENTLIPLKQQKANNDEA